MPRKDGMFKFNRGFMDNRYKVEDNVPNKYPGVFRASVVNNRDPLKLGRVQVRIPSFHTWDTANISDVDLPWATVLQDVAGYDAGSFLIIPVGSTVMVTLEDSDIDSPVVLGCLYSRDASREWFNKYEKESKICSSSFGKAELGKEGNTDIPVDSFKDKSDYEPTVNTLHKSIKGSTIVTNDGDEKESMSFIDRVGQIFTFLSPVSKSSNSYNRSQRGSKSALNGTQYSHDILTQSKAVILLKDLSNQILRFVSHLGKERVELVSRSVKQERDAGVLLESGESDNRFSIFSEDNTKGNRVVFNGDVTNLRCTLQLVINNKEVFSLNIKDKVDINTSLDVSLVGSNVSITASDELNLSAKSVSINSQDLTSIVSGGSVNAYGRSVAIDSLSTLRVSSKAKVSLGAPVVSVGSVLSVSGVAVTGNTKSTPSLKSAVLSDVEAVWVDRKDELDLI